MSIKDLAKQAYQDKLDRERQQKEKEQSIIEQKKKRELKIFMENIKATFGEDIFLFLHATNSIQMNGFNKVLEISDNVCVVCEDCAITDIYEWRMCDLFHNSYCYINTRQELLEILGEHCPHCQD